APPRAPRRPAAPRSPSPPRGSTSSSPRPRWRPPAATPPGTALAGPSPPDRRLRVSPTPCASHSSRATPPTPPPRPRPRPRRAPPGAAAAPLAQVVARLGLSGGPVESPGPIPEPTPEAPPPTGPLGGLPTLDKADLHQVAGPLPAHPALALRLGLRIDLEMAPFPGDPSTGRSERGVRPDMGSAGLFGPVPLVQPYSQVVCAPRN